MTVYSLILTIFNLDVYKYGNRVENININILSACGLHPAATGTLLFLYLNDIKTFRIVIVAQAKAQL